MTKSFLLEAPVYTIEAALLAAEYGVDRIELCADLGEGGETPSAGALKYLKSKIDIPIFVMIRPRGGDFVYTIDELAVMKADIALLRDLGADGFVFGVLSPQGNVNTASCRELIEHAAGLPCTFHRAFDVCRVPEMAIQDIIQCGFSRLLTSGNKNSVTEGLNQIQFLLENFGDQIIVMPGGGLQPHHLPQLKDFAHLKEIHASCKSFRNTQSEFLHPEVKLSNDPLSFRQVITIDKEMVNQFKAQV
jgi:copper homeostasis protein